MRRPGRVREVHVTLGVDDRFIVDPSGTALPGATSISVSNAESESGFSLIAAGDDDQLLACGIENH